MRSDETPHTRIGHEHIIQRRLSRKVAVAAKGFLGDYVPFNFCSRSVMAMIEIATGNLLEAHAEALVNTVNMQMT